MHTAEGHQIYSHCYIKHTLRELCAVLTQMIMQLWMENIGIPTGCGSKRLRDVKQRALWVRLYCTVGNIMRCFFWGGENVL